MELFGARLEIGSSGPWAASAPRRIRCGPVAALIACAIVAGAAAVPDRAPRAVASVEVAPPIDDAEAGVLRRRIAADGAAPTAPARPAAPARTAHYTPAIGAPGARPRAAAEAPAAPRLAR